jgi:hypothetical protein
MLIWGGGDEYRVATGGRYDPASNSWTSTITAQCTGRTHNQSTVWTGDRMIVWGVTPRTPAPTLDRWVYNPGTP